MRERERKRERGGVGDIRLALVPMIFSLIRGEGREKTLKNGDKYLGCCYQIRGQLLIFV